MCICCTVWALRFFILAAGLLARSQYSEGHATGHLETGYSWFPCVYKQMLRWFPRFQVTTVSQGSLRYIGGVGGKLMLLVNI